MANNAPLLQLTDVSREFPSAENDEALVVLQDVSVEISRGESVAIIGPSGSGKSTLLNIIGTLDEPTSGIVIFDDQNLGSLNEDEQASLRNLEIGFIFQSHHLLPQCTVIENVLVPTLANGDPTADTEEHARKLLDRVGLGERLTHRPGQLSGGECQRVAVVRSLINRPKLLLADEPTGALDRASAENLGQLLVELNKEEKVTLIAASKQASTPSHMPDRDIRECKPYSAKD